MFTQPRNSQRGFAESPTVTVALLRKNYLIRTRRQPGLDTWETINPSCPGALNPIQSTVKTYRQFLGIVRTWESLNTDVNRSDSPLANGDTMSQQTEFDASPGTASKRKTAQVHRRGFLTGTAAGFVGGGVVAIGALASRSPDASAENPSGIAATKSEVATGLSGPYATEVDRIVTSIQQQYPDAKFDEHALGMLRTHVSDQVQRSRVLSEFELGCNDRPANLFVPVVPSGQRRSEHA